LWGGSHATIPDGLSRPFVAAQQCRNAASGRSDVCYGAASSRGGALMTLILSNEDVDKVLTMPECIEVMEEAYVELAEGRGVSRTRSDCFTPTARADALYSLKSMDGVVPKLGVGAVRINSDIITWPKRGNNMRREKVPAAPNNRYVGLVLLFSVA
jgi:hypothetical protein